MELSGVAPPENPVELPGVDPPENAVDDDDVSPFLQSDHVSDNESDDKDEDTYTSSKLLQSVVHPEAMPPTVRNVCNLRPRK